MGRNGIGGLVLLMLIPGMLFLGLSGGTSYFGFSMMKSQFDMMSEFSDPKGELELEGNIKLTFLKPTGDPANRRDYAPHVKWAELHEDRTARIESTFDARSLLQDGEELPEDDFLDLFVEARVVRIAEAECDMMKESVARSCKPTRFGAKRDDDEGTLYTSSSTIAFVQATDVGPLPEDTTFTINSKSISHEIKLKDEGVEKTADEAKRDLLAMADRFCAEIRNQYGNCAIGSIGISERSYRDQGEEWRLSAKLTWVTPISMAQELGYSEGNESEEASLDDVKREEEIRKLGAENRSAQEKLADEVKSQASARPQYSPYERSVAALKGEVLIEKKTEAPAAPVNDIRKAEAAPTGAPQPVQTADAVTERESVEAAKALLEVVENKRKTADAETQKETWRKEARALFKSGGLATN
jgi:hypothetical protein